MTSKRQLKEQIDYLKREVSEIRRLTGTVYPNFGPDGSDYHLEGSLASRNFVNNSLANLIDLLPDLWEVTAYKSSERPPEQLFKVRNRLIGNEAFGATEKEAKLAARWSPK